MGHRKIVAIEAVMTHQNPAGEAFLHAVSGVSECRMGELQNGRVDVTENEVASLGVRRNGIGENADGHSNTRAGDLHEGSPRRRRNREHDVHA